VLNKTGVGRCQSVQSALRTHPLSKLVPHRAHAAIDLLVSYIPSDHAFDPASAYPSGATFARIPHDLDDSTDMLQGEHRVKEDVARGRKRERAGKEWDLPCDRQPIIGLGIGSISLPVPPFRGYLVSQRTHDDALTVRSYIRRRPITQPLHVQSGPPCPLFPLIIPSDSFEPTDLPCPSIEVHANTSPTRRFRTKVLDILGVD
jgi:hypothetical protein